MAGELWEVVRTNEKGEVISRVLRTPYLENAQSWAKQWNKSSNIIELGEWHVRQIKRGE